MRLMSIVGAGVLTSLLLAAYNVAHAERLPVRVYTSADGLGSSFVQYLMRDSRGLMWFCTRDGLSRFDGARFVTYRIGDNNSPPGIERITETRDGSYWITTTSGLYRFKPDAVSKPDATNGSKPTLHAEFISPHKGALLEDRSGTLWFGSGFLYRLEETDGEVSLRTVELNLPPLLNSTFEITGLAEAGDGSLWLETSWGLARRLPDSRMIFYTVKTFVNFGNRSFMLDHKDRVWYGRRYELYVLKPEPLESLSNLGPITVRPIQPTYVLRSIAEKEIRLPEKAGELLRFTPGEFLARYPLHRICQTADNHVWVTTDKELLEFDGRVFHRYTTAQGLASVMSSVAEDTAGNLWIGGHTLIRLDRKGLTSYGEADGFHSAAVQAIIQAKDGTLYFADGDFYLNHFDGKRFEAKHPTLPPNPRFLWTSRWALLDSRNEWWILTTEGLYRFSSSDFARPLARYAIRDGLKADAMFQIFEDKRGEIWVSVQAPNAGNHGLARFERSNNRFRTFGESEGFPARKSVSSFAEDNNGNLWLGFYEGGIARFANNRFTSFGTDEGLPVGVIIDMLVDRSGRLWLAATTGGVSRVDDPGAQTPNFTLITTNDGLSSNNIRTLTEDHFGNIYAGTVRGVDRISPETNQIRHYSINDGLTNDFVVDSHCDKDGVLWFATSNGLSRLLPTPDEKHSPPPIWLSGVRIAGMPQALSELGASEIGDLELAPNENNLQIDFFGLDFHPGEMLRYEYRLEGAGGDWSAPTEQPSVTFANLRPGNYRFMVRARNSQGAPSESPAVVSFKILPPVWLRWWFITIALLAVGLTVYAFARNRYQRMRMVLEGQVALRRSREERFAELERVRRRIATDLHDDIGSSLTQISILSEVVRQRTDPNDSHLAEPLSMIAGSSRELVDSMSDIVWAINPQKDHLNDLTQRMRRFASDVLTSRNITFDFNEPAEEDDVPLGANIRREVFLIFKESVNNLVRHSACSEVEIDFQIAAGALRLKVRDDGKGFDTSQNGDGHGLSSMRQRADDIGGHLEVISRVGQGTTITLELALVGSAGVSPA